MKEHIRTMSTQVKYIPSTGIVLRGLSTRCLIFLAAFLALFLTSCGSQYKSYDVIAEFQVPFANASPRWNEVELIEEDEYGRKLYSYESVGVYTNVLYDFAESSKNNVPVSLYMIVQKSDNKFVYCYDSLCYSYVGSFENDNTNIIENLKINNDWGKPLDEKKMNPLSVEMFRDKIIGYLKPSIEDETVKSLEKMIGYKMDDYYLDAIFLEDSTPIFLLREVVNREKNRFGKSYIFYIPDDISKATYLELSDDIQDWNQEIYDFKKKVK